MPSLTLRRSHRKAYRWGMENLGSGEQLGIRGNTRMACARRPIFWWPRKKLAHLEFPHKGQEECVPRGVSKVSPYFEVDESIFGLSFTQLHMEWFCHSS